MVTGRNRTVLKVYMYFYPMFGCILTLTWHTVRLNSFKGHYKQGWYPFSDAERICRYAKVRRLMQLYMNMHIRLALDFPARFCFLKNGIF